MQDLKTISIDPVQISWKAEVNSLKFSSDLATGHVTFSSPAFFLYLKFSSDLATELFPALLSFYICLISVKT